MFFHICTRLIYHLFVYAFMHSETGGSEIVLLLIFDA